MRLLDKWGLWLLPWILWLWPFQANADFNIQLFLKHTCLPEEKLHLAIEQLLQNIPNGSELSVRVSETNQDNHNLVALVQLYLQDDQRLVMERKFVLKKEDCPTAVDLISLVISRYFKDFPIERILRPAAIKKPPSQPIQLQAAQVPFKPPPTLLHGYGFLAANGHLDPWGGDLELGGMLEWGSGQHRLVTSATLHLGAPKELGQGHYADFSALLGIGWAYAAESWNFQSKIRTGALLVTGFGHLENRTHFAPWVDLRVSMGWKWKKVLLGPQLTVSPLIHKATTAEGFSKKIPQVRIGLLVVIPLSG
jgi:hypothetical protein